MSSNVPKRVEQPPQAPCEESGSDPNAAEPRSTRITSEEFATRLRGFKRLGLLAILVILAGNLIVKPLSAVLVLPWVMLSRTPWREIGYVRPKSWAREIAIGVVFGGLFKLVMKALVMPLFGAPAINPAFHYLAGNTAALPGILLAVMISAGFGEETFYRGYLFERFGKLFGASVIAKIAIVVITAAWFGAVHFPKQGLAGVEQAMIGGLVFGAIFAVTGRIWMLMIAHAAFDITAVAMIYWDLESYVAHLIFK